MRALRIETWLRNKPKKMTSWTFDLRASDHRWPQFLPSPKGGKEQNGASCAASRHIETIQIHHLGPCGNKVGRKLFLPVCTCINLGNRTQLGV